MTIAVGFAPDGRGRAVLHLAATLARSAADDLVVCAVIPAPWPPGLARVDAEYRAQLEHQAEAALEQARARLPADVGVSCVVHHARSAAAGLLELAEDREAALVVAGSAAHGGPGYVALGSTTSRLLHSAHVPVALAPRGFRRGPGARVERVNAAFGGSAGGSELVVAAAGVAARVGASLRVASFAVRARPPYTSGVGSSEEATVVHDWVEDVRTAARRTLDEVDALPAVPRELEAVVGQGESWDEALEDVEWEDGDVLVVGSSTSGPVARVFLGSRASQIIRHSPVPVVLVPRAAAVELAEEAARAEAAA
jgi:nucleotide-binding universal stress UspA family protein